MLNSVLCGLNQENETNALDGGVAGNFFKGGGKVTFPVGNYHSGRPRKSFIDFLKVKSKKKKKSSLAFLSPFTTYILIFLLSFFVFYNFCSFSSFPFPFFLIFFNISFFLPFFLASFFPIMVSRNFQVKSLWGYSAPCPLTCYATCFRIF